MSRSSTICWPRIYQPTHDLNPTACSEQSYVFAYRSTCVRWQLSLHQWLLVAPVSSLPPPTIPFSWLVLFLFENKYLLLMCSSSQGMLTLKWCYPNHLFLSLSLSLTRLLNCSLTLILFPSHWLGYLTDDLSVHDDPVGGQCKYLGVFLLPGDGRKVGWYH